MSEADGVCPKHWRDDDEADQIWKKWTLGSSKYKDSFARTALEMMFDGATKAMVARRLGVSMSAFKRWCDPVDRIYKEEFAEAVKAGETFAQGYMEATGLDNLENRRFNNGVWEFFMSRRFREDYGSDKKEEEQGSIMVDGAAADAED